MRLITKLAGKYTFKIIAFAWMGYSLYQHFGAGAVIFAVLVLFHFMEEQARWDREDDENAKWGDRDWGDHG